MKKKNKIGMALVACLIVASVGGTAAFATENQGAEKLEQGAVQKNYGTYATIDENGNVTVKDQDGKEITMPSDKDLGQLEYEGSAAAGDEVVTYSMIDSVGGTAVPVTENQVVEKLEQGAVQKNYGSYGTIDENGNVTIKDHDGKEITMPSDKNLGKLEYEGSAVAGDVAVTNIF